MVRRSSSQLTETVGLLEGDLLGVVVGIAVVGDTEGDFEGDWLGPEVGRDVTSKTTVCFASMTSRAMPCFKHSQPTARLSPPPNSNKAREKISQCVEILLYEYLDKK